MLEKGQKVRKHRGNENSCFSLRFVFGSRPDAVSSFVSESSVLFVCLFVFPVISSVARLFVVVVFITRVCFPETIQALALHLMAELWVVGGAEQEEEEESYWNHRNAAPVGSITFLEKKKTGSGGVGGEKSPLMWRKFNSKNELTR